MVVTQVFRRLGKRLDRPVSPAKFDLRINAHQLHRPLPLSRCEVLPPEPDRTWRRYGAVKAFAQAAEDLGYDHIVIYDHVLGAVHAGREPKLTGPYKETDPFHEPLVTYAYLAGVTRTSDWQRA